MPNPPHVLFIVLDGVRRDRLSLYSHDRDTTPILNQFAEDAVVFENAYTPAPWTVPSHTSMFTGTFPSEHGVTNAFSGEPLGVSKSKKLLAEALAEKGYRTAGLSNNPWIGKTTGLDRGFDLFIEWDLEINSTPPEYDPTVADTLHSRLHSVIGMASRQPLALVKHAYFTSRLLETANSWISRSSDASFTFLNLMGAHTPFYPPRSSFESLGLETPSPVESRRLNLNMLQSSLSNVDQPERASRAREFYDASIHDQDRQLGKFFDELKQSGCYDESLIVICADHGKTLGEFNREANPPHYLRDINIKVPLVIKYPGQDESIKETDPFELTHLFNLILDNDPDVNDPSKYTTEYALIEDFIPHTGAEPTSTTHWQAITDGDDKLVMSENDEAYLLEGSAMVEKIAEDNSRMEQYQNLLKERTSRLNHDQAGVDSDGETVSDRVESQLKDLGYF